MKTRLLFFAVLCIVLASCNTRTSKSKEETSQKDSVIKQETKPLITKITTVTGTGENQKTNEIIKNESSSYFEISLNQVTNDGKIHFVALKQLERIVTLEDLKLVNLSLCDENGDEILFSNSTEFLNYMSDRKYELFEKTDHSLRTDYVFKRKE